MKRRFARSEFTMPRCRDAHTQSHTHTHVAQWAAIVLFCASHKNPHKNVTFIPLNSTARLICIASALIRHSSHIFPRSASLSPPSTSSKIFVVFLVAHTLSNDVDGEEAKKKSRCDTNGTQMSPSRWYGCTWLHCVSVGGGGAPILRIFHVHPMKNDTRNGVEEQSNTLCRIFGRIWFFGAVSGQCTKSWVNRACVASDEANYGTICSSSSSATPGMQQTGTEKRERLSANACERIQRFHLINLLFIARAALSTQTHTATCLQSWRTNSFGLAVASARGHRPKKRSKKKNNRRTDLHTWVDLCALDDCARRTEHKQIIKNGKR